MKTFAKQQTWMVLGAALATASTAEAQVRVAPRVGVELVPVRHLQLRLTERFLYGAHIASSGRAQTYAEIEYSPLSWLDLAAGYRISFETYRAAYWSGHRTTLDAVLSRSWRGFRVAGRLRWLSRWEEHSSGYLFNTRIRSRLKLRYRPTKPLDLFVSGEVFSSILPLSYGVETFRVEAGLVARLRPFELEFGWRYQMPIEGSSHAYHMMITTLVWHWDRRGPRAPRQRGSHARSPTGSQGTNQAQEPDQDANE